MENIMLPGQNDCIFNSTNSAKPAKDSKVFPLLSLKGRSAIVTGASAGIGFAVVEAFAEAGANVALWYNTSKVAIEKAANISKKYGVLCKAYQVNITEEKSVKAAVEEAVRDLNGRLDIFVANAGIPWLSGSLIDSDSEEFMNLFNVNFTSVYFAAKAAGNHFRRQNLEKTNIYGKPLGNYSQGSFIITTSISGMRQLMPQAGTPYGVSKAALIHLTKCLAVEWIQFARVNCISPAYITTEMLDQAPDIMRNPWHGRTPMGREGSVSEVKGAFIYLASDAASYTTGSNLVVDGGYTCV
ncbi:hypothetical protein H072_1577 [Dactylellina haptotyla CBS 200.50]|uniref:L-xylulose reductase n=1 Tax=Dactylellina haptotyla (strain CBS 200.50) TaxID=1284197 RepID=S8C9W0_DACHA|nr:hypothetical protein H072_1577 [Dactylellina haptotyla CBS 200.50]